MSKEKRDELKQKFEDDFSQLESFQSSFLFSFFEQKQKIQELLKKPLFQLTTEEFLFINNKTANEITPSNTDQNAQSKKYVYGIKGIATLFGCSKPTANRLKKSKKIDAAITQIGRKIIVDADLAMKLAKVEKGGRK